MVVDYSIVNTIIAIVLVCTSCFIAIFIIVRAFPRDSNYKVKGIIRYPDKPIVKKLSSSKKEFVIKRLGKKRSFDIIPDAIKHNTLIYNYDCRSPLIEDPSNFSKLKPIMSSADAEEISETSLLQRLAASKMMQTGLLLITIVSCISAGAAIISLVSTQNSLTEMSTKIDTLSTIINQTRTVLAQPPRVIAP